MTYYFFSPFVFCYHGYAIYISDVSEILKLTFILADICINLAGS